MDVRDNGPGISPDDQAIIFDKFRQVGDALTDKPQGTGLGLHISRHIVEHYGGRLWVNSRPGGAPASHSPFRSVREPAPGAVPLTRSGRASMSKKVLIADDEPNIVTSLEYLMTKSGYEVEIARNGEEALALVESFLPDLVLLDVMMPHKSGYEVCQRIRERADWQHIKIVMLSAKGREAEVNKGPFAWRRHLRYQAVLQPGADRKDRRAARRRREARRAMKEKP